MKRDGGSVVFAGLFGEREMRGNWSVAVNGIERGNGEDRGGRWADGGVLAWG